MGKLDKIRSAIGLAASDGVTVVQMSVAAAEANLDAARTALRAASAGVEDAVAAFPAGMADRRWLGSTGVGSQSSDPRRAKFDAALRIEEEARRVENVATAELGKAQRYAELAGGRANLKIAIEAAKLAGREAEKVQAAVDRARRMLASASDRHERATDEAAKAKRERTERMISAASSGVDMEPDQTLRDARQREADAADVVGAAQEALAAVEAAASQPVIEATEAGKKIDAAIRAIMLAEVPRLKAEVIAIERERLRKASALAFAVSFVDFHNCDHQERTALQSFVGRHRSPFDIPDADAVEAEAQRPWQAAQEALKLDADAPLPEVR